MGIPEFLKQKILDEYGENIGRKILEGYDKNRKTTLRVNKIKSSVFEVEEKLKNKEIQYSKVAWYNEAIIIEDGIENDIKQMDMYDKRRDLFTEFVFNDTANHS